MYPAKLFRIRKPSTVWILWAVMPFLRTTSSNMAATHEALPGLSQAHGNEVSCDERTPLSALAFLDLDSNSEQSQQFDDHQKIQKPHSILNPATGQGSSPLAFFQNHHQLSYDQNRSQVWPSALVQPHDILVPSRSLGDEYEYGQCDHLKWPEHKNSARRTKQRTTRENISHGKSDIVLSHTSWLPDNDHQNPQQKVQMTSVFEAATDLHLSKPINIDEHSKLAINQNNGGLPYVSAAPEKSDLQPLKSYFPEIADSRGFMSVYEGSPELYMKSSRGSIMSTGEKFDLPSHQIQNNKSEPTESINTAASLNSESGSSSKGYSLKKSKLMEERFQMAQPSIQSKYLSPKKGHLNIASRQSG
ncbi:hypothetical protein PGT21_002128 [Puccinia graminis f. sp. tritici]|uniref:Uncharacterized protein n=1 Tax=Puccinia graminis f. sp. tritici TaxID=56615 RepID=A0A5B0LWD4_PUCGR|nr:hypothetical protein PGT21_002128 [Puccinia graminis f. sp. tritici]